jgi:hypothetical protein
MRSPEQVLQDQYSYYTAEFDKQNDWSHHRIVVPLDQIVTVLKVVEYWTEVVIKTGDSPQRIQEMLRWLSGEQALTIMEDFVPLDYQVLAKLRSSTHMKRVIETAYRYSDEISSDWIEQIKCWQGPERNNITKERPNPKPWSGWNYNDVSFFFKDPSMAMMFKLKWM